MMDSFYNQDGEKRIPSWFPLCIEDICFEIFCGDADFGNVEAIKEVIEMYEDDEMDFFYELGVFITDLMVYHCNRELTELYKIDSRDFKKLYIQHKSKIDNAYKSWETKKNNLKKHTQNDDLSI